MKFYIVYLLCLNCFIRNGLSKLRKLQEQFAWSSLDFEYPNEAMRTQALLTQRFVPENNLPVGIEIWEDKLFVTVPRWRVGIPSTLNYIPISSISKSPRLIPYPDWPSNELGNCDSGLSTVYRIHADACDRLWVLDTGTFGIGNTTQNPCPYALNIFDLRTNRRLLRYPLRPEDTNPRTFIANIAVDLGSTCDDAHAYLSDELGYGLIVYSLRENRSWRFNHGFFHPDPLSGSFTIAGLTFQWFEEGVFGLGLSPKTVFGDRILYFSPLASYKEFAVSTTILKNSSKVDDSYGDFFVVGDRGVEGHTTAKIVDEVTGVQLFNLIDLNAVGCWDSAKEYNPENIAIVAKDDTRLIFPADVKIDRSGRVWVISDQMSTFLESSLDFESGRDNFRIFWAPLDELIAGTVCKPNAII